MPRHDAATLDVLKLRPEASLPLRAHEDDAGLDLHCADDVVVGPGEGKVVPTGIAVAVPQGHVGMIADRSSMAKRGLKVAGGIVDAGYRGEVGVVLWNLSREPVRLGRGDRVAQLLILPIAVPAVRETESFERRTSRGQGGFGSTGQ